MWKSASIRAWKIVQKMFDKKNKKWEKIKTWSSNSDNLNAKDSTPGLLVAPDTGSDYNIFALSNVSMYRCSRKVVWKKNYVTNNFTIQALIFMQNYTANLQIPGYRGGNNICLNNFCRGCSHPNGNIWVCTGNWQILNRKIIIS